MKIFSLDTVLFFAFRVAVYAVLAVLSIGLFLIAVRSCPSADAGVWGYVVTCLESGALLFTPPFMVPAIVTAIIAGTLDTMRHLHIVGTPEDAMQTPDAEGAARDVFFGGAFFMLLCFFAMWRALGDVSRNIDYFDEFCVAFAFVLMAGAAVLRHARYFPMLAWQAGKGFLCVWGYGIAYVLWKFNHYPYESLKELNVDFFMVFAAAYIFALPFAAVFSLLDKGFVWFDKTCEDTAEKTDA